MRITILPFASAREILSSDRIELDLPGEATVAAALAALAARHPALPDHASRWRIAVDAEFADGATPLHEGAEIALLPPMSGG